jgi:uncharacterized protein YodC (DUF2158 family)
MAEKFKVGDVVQLNSGGPKMTVTKIDDEYVNTTWFAGDERMDGSFPSDTLSAVREGQKDKW